MLISNRAAIFEKVTYSENLKFSETVDASRQFPISRSLSLHPVGALIAKSSRKHVE